MLERVAVVTESFLPQVNGVTGSVLRVLETLKQKEIQSLVIAPTAPAQLHLGFPVREMPSMQVLDFPVAVPNPAVSRILNDFQPDVVHVAAPFLLGAQALSWANRVGVPSVAVYQTDVAGYLDRYNLKVAKPLMEKLTLTIHQLATINLAPTKQTANYLAALGIGNVAIWGRGVDRDLFDPRLKADPETLALRRQFAADEEVLIGFVGRLAQEKQVHRMAELFGLPGTRFVVVGDGPQRSKLEEQFKGKPVIFTGALSGLDLARHYAALDVFTHFGTEETFGQTIQEAKSMGLAVVAPDAGGPTELIEHGRTGLLVDPAIEGGYRRAVETLLSSERRAKLGVAAAESVATKSWAANNAQLLGYYQRAQTVLHTRRAEQLELA